MAKTKLLTRIGTFVLAVITSVTFASCTAKKSPMEMIEEAADVNYTAISEKSEMVKKLEKFSNSGSFEIKADVGKLLGMAGLGGLDLSASVKAFGDIENEKAALTADIISGGASVADILLYIADKSVSASSNALFGDTAYGFSTEDFFTAFDNSEFGENGAYSLGIASKNIQNYLDSIGLYAKSAEAMQEYEDKIAVSCEKIKEELYPLFENTGTSSIATGTLEIANNSIKTTDVCFTYVGEQIVTLAEGILNLLETNEAVPEMIEALYDMQASILSAELLQDESFGGFTVEELMNEVQSFIDEARGELDSFREVADGYTVSYTVHISKATKELIGATVHITEGETYYGNVKIICGPSMTDINEISVNIELYDGEYDEKVNQYVKYAVSEDSADKYAAELTYDIEGESGRLAGIVWNKQSGELDINLDIEGTAVAVKGKLINEKDSVTLAVNTVSYGFVSLDLGEIAFILHTNDTMPAAIESYTDILSMDKAGIEDLLGEISVGLQNILSVIGAGY